MGIAKLADFGLAKTITEAAIPGDSTIGKGTIRYMAPEQFNLPATEKSDIFAFGMIIWELVTRKYPYYEATNEVEIVRLKADENYKFKFPSSTPRTLKEIGEQCLNFNYNFRPTAAVVLYELEKNDDSKL